MSKRQRLVFKFIFASSNFHTKLNIKFIQINFQRKYNQMQLKEIITEMPYFQADISDFSKKMSDAYF